MVVYLTRTGILEPLGRSQIVAYLEKLSFDHDIIVFSQEKLSDLANGTSVRALEKRLASMNIVWKYSRFYAGPKVVAPAISIFTLCVAAIRESRRNRPVIIHARSYLPAFAALLAYKVTGKPFIFDMRALWPEELITAGRLRRGSITHRTLVWMERACLRRASAVVSLTRAGADHLRRIYPRELEGKEIAIIPTCADLSRFRPDPPPPDASPVFGCFGTVLSGWFRMDWLAAFFRVMAKRELESRFHVVTRDDAEAVRAGVDSEGSLGDRLEIFTCAPERVHEAVQRQQASVMFFSSELGKLGSCPTRMAEALGCGIPIVANEGVGDVAEIIHKHRVGLLATAGDEQAMEAVVDELEELLKDPELSARCRKVAEQHFSLDAGVAEYNRIYRRILDAQMALR